MESLKAWLNAGNLAPIIVASREYTELNQTPYGHLWTTDSYSGERLDHANTVVGYNDSFGPYTENGETRYGAFKIVNSWSSRFADDGFYWISYAAMEERVNHAYIVIDRINYKPTLVSVFQIDHAKRNECQITIGIGNRSSPEATKEFFPSRESGALPFPDNAIVFDLTDILSSVPTFTGKNYFLEVKDVGTNTTGIISNFSVEYFSDYLSGNASKVVSSSDPPASTVNDEKVYAELTLGIGNWIASGLWHIVNTAPPDAPAWNISHSGEKSWWFGIDETGNYDLGHVAGSLISKEIDLTNSPTAVLSFWSWYQTDTTGTETDRRCIIIRNSTYSEVIQLSGEPMRNWSRKVIDISKFVGSYIAVEFFFDSINQFENAYSGWYIDDVEVITSESSSSDFAGNGILYIGGSDSLITNNTISSNTGNGILCINSSGLKIGNDTVGNNLLDGIRLENTIGVEIADNTISFSNSRYGVYVFSSTESKIAVNVFDSEYGIYLKNSLNNTIETSTIWNISYGIHIEDSPESKVTNSAIAHANYGIHVVNSNDVWLKAINISSLEYGVNVLSSDNVSVSNTHIWKADYGLYLSSSIAASVYNNTMLHTDVFIDGKELKYWNTHKIGSSNTVNSKPLYYWKNLTTGEIPSNAGEIILANCSDISIKNQSLNNATVGLQIGYSHNNLMENTTISGNLYGAWLYASNENTIRKNNISSNEGHNLYLYSSSNNTISNNSVSHSLDSIHLVISDNNMVSGNLVTNNFEGMYLFGSGNTVINNSFNDNIRYGIVVGCPANNTIVGNSVKRNVYGIFLATGQNLQGHTNIIRENRLEHNKYGLFAAISNNTIIKNVCYHNQYGIYLESESLTNRILLNNLSKNNWGIYLNTGASMNNISGNDAFNNNYSLYLRNSNNGNLIDENNFHSNTHCGVFISHSIQNILEGNRVLNNFYGLNLVGISNTFVGKNVLSNNSEINLGLTLSHNVVLEENKLAGAHTGLQMIGARNNIIRNNRISGNQNGSYSFVSSFNLFEKNDISGNSAYGFYGYRFSRHNLFTENRMLNNSNGLCFRQSSSNSILNNLLSNNRQSGVYLSASNNNLISNNTISDNARFGIHFTGVSSLNRVEANNVMKNTHGGIYLHGSRNNLIQNNSITHSENGSGIYSSNSRGTTIRGNDIYDNDHGISLLNSDAAISANIIHSNPHGGIYLNASASEIYDNNIFGNYVFHKPTHTGIDMVDSQNVFIHDNNLSFNIGGIYSINSSNITIERNTIWEITGWDVGWDYHGAIGIDSVSSQATVRDNTIYGCYYAMRIENADNMTVVKNNSINPLEHGSTNAATIGLYLVNASIGIYENSINGTGTGIKLMDNSSAIIENNTITNGTRGIHSVWSSSTIKNNIISGNDWGIYSEFAAPINAGTNGDQLVADNPGLTDNTEGRIIQIWCVAILVQSSDGTPQEGVHVKVYPYQQTESIYDGYTNSSGMTEHFIAVQYVVESDGSTTLLNPHVVLCDGDLAAWITFDHNGIYIVEV